MQLIEKLSIMVFKHCFQTAPNGSKVAARVVQQPTGDFKVDYTSPFTGLYTLL